MEELSAWHKASSLPIRKFFNTSGNAYKEGNIKELLDGGASDQEAYELLASNGMLVKRPILVSDSPHLAVAVGFKPEEWEALLPGC